MGYIITLAILSVIVIAILLFVIGIYNTLVKLKNRYLNSFAQIEVQLKRRHDLIPNLVETVKGYMTHEKETFEKVIAARNQAAALLEAASKNPSDQSAMTALAGAQGALSGAVGGLMAVMEAYPDLKADSQSTMLQEELTSTENKIAFARQSYNDSVTSYNTYRQSFPPVLIAPVVGHPTDAAFLEFEDSAQIQQAPSASLS
ncbi:MAG: LemA family protein [Phycisphaerales bacterium]|nr:LemA family protein [Phycisphaerales bacterium]